MSIANKLKNLLVNPDVSYVMKTIDSDNYSKLSFNEKADLLIAFNDVLNEVFDHSLTLYINKKPSKEYEARTVSANMEEARLVINGVENNPYNCLRDLLLMQLSYDDIENYDYIQIGEVRYDENFVYEFPQLGFYNEENFKYLRASNKFINTLIENANNPYKKEFEKDFDNNLTKQALQDMRAGYDSMDSCLKRGVYQEMDAFSNKIGEMVIKEELPIEELAMLSLDEVATSYMHNDVLQEEEQEELFNCDHYNQFIRCFFKEYAEYINISFDDLGLTINERDLIENEIFMDVLMQEIEVIENNYHLIDSIVSDEMLERFNKKLNKNYSKLDCYFYSKLDILDSYLKDKKFEIINYNKWTSIYRDDNKESIFEDKRELFADLLESEEFISIVETYLYDKKAGEKELIKIMKMMNDSYGAKFKLIINNQALLETSMGIADDMGCIYINADNIREKISTLITLFHEYRHLIQKHECEHNSNLFNDNIYEYVKMENEVTSCGNEYQYAEMNRFGYINDKFYAMQPTEYDAELFAEKFMKKIEEKMNNNEKKIDYSLYVCENYRNSKFIDSEKYSIASYKNYLIVNEIPQSKQEEEERFLIIKEQIEKAKTKEDGIAIIKDPIFTALKMHDKVKVFNLLTENEIKIIYSKSKKQLTIDDIKVSTMMASDYEVIESIISINADKKIAKGELKFTNRNEYIYKELSKYKYNCVEEFNCFAPHSYYRTLTKYLKELTKDNKKDTKRKRK